MCIVSKERNVGLLTLYQNEFQFVLKLVLKTVRMNYKVLDEPKPCKYIYNPGKKSSIHNI